MHRVAISVICDGINRTNQSFFKKFKTVVNKSWLTSIDGLYLLYDYVHVIKNILNLWVPEKILQLEYEFDDVKFIADYS